MDQENIQIERRTHQDPFASYLKQSILGLINIEATISFLEVLIAVLRILVLLSVIVVDLLLCCIIVKFKRLNTRTNQYIFHYSLINIIYTVLNALLTVYYLYFLDLRRDWYCVIIEIENCSLCLCVLFTVGLAVDWFIMTCKQHILVIYNKKYHYLIAIIYCAIIVKYFVFTPLCFQNVIDNYKTDFLIIEVGYIYVVLLILLLNYFNYRQNQPANTIYSLKVATLLTLSWFPLFIYQLVLEACDISGRYLRLSYIFMIIPEILGYGGPIWMAIVLNQSNKYFKLAFKNVLSMRNKTCADESLEEISEEGNCK